MNSILNGKWVEEKLSTSWIQDRGRLLGDGLFETIRIKRGSPVYLISHWSRLSQSANYLQFDLPLDKLTFFELVHSLCDKLDFDEGGIRFTVTRGQGQRGLSPKECRQPVYTLSAFKRVAPPTQYRLGYASIRRNETSPLTRLKNVSSLENILNKQEAERQGWDDVLCLNTKGRLTETTICNFFLIENDIVLTPPESEGVLPGVMREQVCAFCHEKGIPFHITSLEPSQITNKTAAFLSNVLIGVKPVSEIQGISLADSEISRLLMQQFL